MPGDGSIQAAFEVKSIRPVSQVAVFKGALAMNADALSGIIIAKPASQGPAGSSGQPPLPLPTPGTPGCAPLAQPKPPLPNPRCAARPGTPEATSSSRKAETNSRRDNMSHSSIPKKRKLQPPDVGAAGAAAVDAAVDGGFSPSIGAQPAVAGTPTPPPPNQFRVMKFGGSSVGSAARLAAVADQIQAELLDPSVSDLAVVVSAQGNTTDWLLSAAEHASSGNLAAAERLVQTIASTAITNAFAAAAMPPSPLQSPWRAAAAVSGLSCESDPLGTLLNENGKRASSSASSSSSCNMSNLVANVTKLLEPLRKVFQGMSLLRQNTPQGLDYALSFGERLSAIALASLLTTRNKIPSLFVDARTWVRTDDHFGMANVDFLQTRLLVGSLWQTWRSAGRVSVHTGFIGSSGTGHTTTLGRNGSDFSATLLGGALQASRVVISTDVPGVMTCDPRIDGSAKPVEHLTYSEAIELAIYGTKLFHPRTFFPLIESGVPMVIRQTGSDGPGTRIDGRIEGHDASTAPSSPPTCVTSLEHLAMIEVTCVTSDAKRNLGQIISTALASFNVLLESQSAHGHSVVVLVAADRAAAATAALNEALAREITRKDVKPPSAMAPVTMLSVVSEHMRHQPAIAARATTTLAGLKVNILACAQAERSFTCVIPGIETARSVRAVHSAFNLAHQQASVFIIGAPQCEYGSSTTAWNLVRLMSQEAARLLSDSNLELRLCGVAIMGGRSIVGGALGVVGDEDAIKFLSAVDSTPAGVVNGLDIEAQALDVLKGLPNPLVIDCSGAEGRADFYRRALANSVSVVVSNTRSLIGLPPPMLRHLYYESSVGGSLPLLSVIRNSRESGDRVFKVVCALSGSLNYIAEQICAGKALSEAVQLAMREKLMESDPRIDLSGRDVAQKLLIIARSAGYEMQMADIDMQPFVDAAVIGAAGDGDDTAALVAALKGHDASWKGCTVGTQTRYLYLGVLTFEAGKATATLGFTAVDQLSGAWGMTGKEVGATVFSALVKQGTRLCSAGQGGPSGASGCLTDILRLCQALRGGAYK